MEQFAQNIKDFEVTTVDRARQAIADKRQQLSSLVVKLALTAVSLLEH